MPKVKQSTLAGLVNSDSDDGFAMPAPGSMAGNRVTGDERKGKGRGRPKADPAKPAPSKITKAKAKAPARRTSGRLVAKELAEDTPPVAAKSRRPVLKDKTNQHVADEDVDEFAQDGDLVMEDMVEDSIVAMQKTKPQFLKKTAAARGKAAKDKSHPASLIEDTQVKAPTTRRRGPAQKQKPVEPSPEKIIQETQYEEMDVDVDTDEAAEDEAEHAPASKPARNPSRTHSDCRQRQPSSQRRRAGSASDTERSDPTLRRKLGEMTKKYETLNLKYQDLRQIGIKEAAINFDALRKERDAEKKTAGDLVRSLNVDIASKVSWEKKAEALNKKLDLQTAETTSLQAQLALLKTSFSEVQSENKTLSAKLAATRIAAASVESAHSKTPGSVLKSNGGIRLMGSAEAAQAAQAAQLKEDLYRDLTGLIIRGVKREEEEDVFDCLQTGGRNGTNEKSSESYDDAQCNYIPQLDLSRDKSLMELLPDYLVDEITFPRPQAAKFYARVVKALTEKPADR
ncbi:chromosome segregation protein [Diplocarpon rosae]|nr:chromosome segregation protein [Diplocarpon rosae]